MEIGAFLQLSLAFEAAMKAANKFEWNRCKTELYHNFSPSYATPYKHSYYEADVICFISLGMRN